MSVTLEQPTVASSGDKCPRRKCKGRIQVVDTAVKGDHRIRYLGCRMCGYRPVKNKIIVPIAYAPKRKPDIEVYDA